MDINIYVLISLVLRVAAVILPIIWVLPKQIEEIRRPDNGFSWMRRGLFNSVVLWLIFLSASIPYMTSRLHDSMVFDFREMTSLIVSCIGLAKSINWVLMYTIFVKGDK